MSQFLFFLVDYIGPKHLAFSELVNRCMTNVVTRAKAFRNPDGWDHDDSVCWGSSLNPGWDNTSKCFGL